jgi:hypothetical protein
MLALLLASAVPVASAGDAMELIPAGAEFEFGGLRFGQGAPKEMVCVSGACLKSEDGKPPRSPVASYKFPRDITFYGDVEITPPVYEFYEDQLVRVRFQLLCPPEKADRCIDAVFAALKEEFGMTAHDRVIDRRSGQEKPAGRIGLLGSGDEVVLAREKVAGSGAYPTVRIENPGRMEELRRVLNPAYVPRPSRFPPPGRQALGP